MSALRDITGQRFGMLVAIERDGVNHKGEVTWRSRCDCGGLSSVSGTKLRGGYTTSCGCQMSRKTHGLSGQRLHRIWTNMKTRCGNSRCRAFPRYGGRGIIVCEDWRNDASSFICWALANGYRDDLQIDRIDNDGPYSPENCRFTTPSTNSRNRSNTKIVELHGEKRALIDVAEEYGIVASCLRYRLDEMHLPIDRALNLAEGL